MQSLFNIYVGYALSEITDEPDPKPTIEKSIPEIPLPRLANTELDMTGKTEPLAKETDRELKEVYNEKNLVGDDGGYKNAIGTYPLEVVIPEFTPIYHHEGKLIDEKTRLPLARSWGIKYNYPYSQEGKPFEDKIVEYPSIRCYYLGNRNASVPHITMGEQVLVYHYLGNDIYYWKELGRDNDLPRIEKYRIFCNDQQSVKKRADVELQNENRPNDDNSYYMEFDTINKHILLGTSASDGEKVRYWFKMNPKDQCLTIWDTDGNRFEIDSKEHRLFMRNRDQTTIDLHNSDINIWSPKSINIESDTINLTGRLNYNETVGVDPQYKAKQIAAKLHQQSYSGVGPMLVGGDKVFPPLTGVGNKVKNVATKETFTTPLKQDIINQWIITNQLLNFAGQIIQSVAKSHTTSVDNIKATSKTIQKAVEQFIMQSKLCSITGNGVVDTTGSKLTSVKNFACAGSHPWAT